MTIEEDIRRHRDQVIARYSDRVSGFPISPDCHMLQSSGKNIEHYPTAACSMMNLLDNFMGFNGLDAASFKNILDFGCGHGRVMRGFKALFPDAQLHGYDIDPAMLDFCAKTFDCLPIKAPYHVEETALPANSFDLIWLGSIFTHTKFETLLHLLDILKKALTPNGYLVFTLTSHAQLQRVKSAAKNDEDLAAIEAAEQEYIQHGTAFLPYKGIKDRNWGRLYTSPSLIAKTAKEKAFHIEMIIEGGWCKSQDAVILSK